MLTSTLWKTVLPQSVGTCFFLTDGLAALFCLNRTPWIGVDLNQGMKEALFPLLSSLYAVRNLSSSMIQAGLVNITDGFNP